MNAFTNILVVTLIVLGVSLFYFLKYPLMSKKAYFQSVISYYKNKGKFVFTANIVREIIVLMISIIIGVVIFLYFTTDFGKEYCCKFIDVIRDNFTNKYPLITTIIGAFIALMINYIFVRAKVLVSPDIIYDNHGDKRYFSWYVENRSIFGCVNISIEAHKIKMINGDAVNVGTLSFRKDNASFLAGRNTANNDNAVCFTLKDDELTVKQLKNNDFDFILVYVKFTHALSSITNVIKKQFLIEDIYLGDIKDGKCYVKTSDNAPETELKTLKTEALRRFMFARKYVSLSIMLISAWFIVCLTMQFQNEYIIYATEVLSEAAAVIIIEFSVLRFLFNLRTETNRNDKNYDHRIVNMKEN